MNGRWPPGPGRRGGRSASVVLLFSLLSVAGFGSPALSQEDLTLTELEDLYRGAVGGYEEAFAVLEVLESQFDRASLDLAAASAENDEEAINRAFAETQRLAPLRRQALRRVEEKAAELREARERLRAATASHLEEFLAQMDRTVNPAERQALTAFVADTRNRLAELTSLEDPPTTLEPESDINAEPQDAPSDLRAKANILEVKAGRYEEQLAYNQSRLEGLRRDQLLLRVSGDFLAGITRFDDPTVPVGPPESRTVPPPGEAQLPPSADSTQTGTAPLTLEQKIQALELLQEEITQRIQNMRIRAASLRRQAGGEWA